MARIRPGFRLRRGQNLADLTDKVAARQSLGLGSAATSNDDRYAIRAANLGDIPDKGAARSNLGLGNAVIKHIAQNTNGTEFNSASPPDIGNISGSGNGDNVALTIANGGNNSASAVIQFHRAGSHASYFGLDTDNQYKVGGRSMGGPFRLWHDGNAHSIMGSRGTGIVGSFALLLRRASTDPGTLVAGGELFYASGNGDAIGQPVGTWRSMGATRGSGSGPSETTLWMRVV